MPEVSVPKVNVPSVAEMAPPPRPAPAPAKEEAKVEEVVEEEGVADLGPAAPAPVEPEAAAPAPVEEEAAAPAPAAEKKAGRVYDETYAESKSEMVKAAKRLPGARTKSWSRGICDSVVCFERAPTFSTPRRDANQSCLLL